MLSPPRRDASAVEHGRLRQFLAGAPFRVHMHVMKYRIELHTEGGVITMPVFDEWVEAMKDATEYCLSLSEEARNKIVFKTLVWNSNGKCE